MGHFCRNSAVVLLCTLPPAFPMMRFWVTVRPKVYLLDLLDAGRDGFLPRAYAVKKVKNGQGAEGGGRERVRGGADR